MAVSQAYGKIVDSDKAAISGRIHNIIIGYESMAGMERWAAIASASAGFSPLLHNMVSRQ
ncbi:MAG: hypothetical protein ACI9R8_001738 [Candidatus Paceibacteria bacterium]|jgi:hypothetical protein